MPKQSVFDKCPDNHPRYIDCDEWLKVLDQLHIGAFTIDRHRRITCFNRSAKSIVRSGGNDVIGRDCREVFHNIPCYIECPFHVTSAVQDTSDLELSGDDSTPHFISRFATPLYGPDQEMNGCLTVLQDHSPIAELISKVSYEERSMKIILDNLNIGIFTVNRGRYITFFNRTAETITGYNRRDVIGKPAAMIFGRRNASGISLLQESIREGRPRNSLEGEVLTCEGVAVPIRANYLPLQNEQGKIIGGLVTLQDLTLLRRLDQVIRNRYTFHQIIGRDAAMQKIFEIVKVAAPSEATILIEGTTGTGKDLLAKVIHSASNRAEKPMIKVNCAALPENLLESELFGYVRGAFTGADRDKPGRFQQADGGTIFLDEIGDLPLSLQAKLLRVLEEKNFYPLGSHRVVSVDVRIIAATNRGLTRLVEQGLFREDLFYRLNVLQIELPPLSNRPSDIPLLIRHILRRLCAEQDLTQPEISDRAMSALLDYHYPGNVRELENILEHALILSQSQQIQLEHLPEYVRKRTNSRPLTDGGGEGMNRRAGEEERSAILAALRACNWRREKAALALNMNRTTLWRKMKRYRILP